MSFSELFRLLSWLLPLIMLILWAVLTLATKIILKVREHRDVKRNN